MNEETKPELLKEDEDEKPFYDKIATGIENLPVVIKESVDKFFDHSLKKQESKERIELRKIDNEKHEGNLKAGLLVCVFIGAVTCYLVKGIDQTMGNIICFLIGFIANGFRGFSATKSSSNQCLH